MERDCYTIERRALDKILELVIDAMMYFKYCKWISIAVCIIHLGLNLYSNSFVINKVVFANAVFTIFIAISVCLFSFAGSYSLNVIYEAIWFSEKYNKRTITSDDVYKLDNN